MTDDRSRWWTASDWMPKVYYTAGAAMSVSVFAGWTTATTVFGAAVLTSVALSVLFAFLGYRAGRASFRRRVWAGRAGWLRSRRH